MNKFVLAVAIIAASLLSSTASASVVIKTTKSPSSAIIQATGKDSHNYSFDIIVRQLIKETGAYNELPFVCDVDVPATKIICRGFARADLRIIEDEFNKTVIRFDVKELKVQPNFLKGGDKELDSVLIPDAYETALLSAVFTPGGGFIPKAGEACQGGGSTTVSGTECEILIDEDGESGQRCCAATQTFMCELSGEPGKYHWVDKGVINPKADCTYTHLPSTQDEPPKVLVF